MSFYIQHLLKAVVLASFAFFIIQLHYTGDITKYINPKYEMLSLIGLGVFILLTIIQLFRITDQRNEVHDEHCEQCCDHDHGNSSSMLKKVLSFSIIIFPLLSGFSLSPTVLDSSIAEKKGTLLPTYNSASVEESIQASLERKAETEEAALPNENYFSEEEYNEKMQELVELDVIKMEDDLYLPYYDSMNFDPQALKGKKIEVIGFVYKEEGMKENQLVVSRFAITHCIADASIVGLMTEFDEASDYEEDMWLKIEGVLDVTTFNGVEMPIIHATNWEKIDTPEQPYVYPAMLKLTE